MVGGLFVLIHRACRRGRRPPAPPAGGPMVPPDPRCAVANRERDSQNEQYVSNQRAKILKTFWRGPEDSFRMLTILL